MLPTTKRAFGNADRFHFANSPDWHYHRRSSVIQGFWTPLLRENLSVSLTKISSINVTYITFSAFYSASTGNIMRPKWPLPLSFTLPSSCSAICLPPRPSRNHHMKLQNPPFVFTCSTVSFFSRLPALPHSFDTCQTVHLYSSPVFKPAIRSPPGIRIFSHQLALPKAIRPIEQCCYRSITSI